MTEDQLEQETLGWLAQVGYTPLFGPDLSPDGPAQERADCLAHVGEVLMRKQDGCGARLAGAKVGSRQLIYLGQMNDPVDAAGHVCRACSSANLAIEYGKYGYYFKCRDCLGNTPIKLGCGHAGHKERLRKEGPKFFRECAECKTSLAFFQNP